jgi:hypothetical protein
LTDTTYVGLGLLAAGVAGGVQYGGWRRFGGARVATGDPEARRRALRAWVLFAVVWQLAVLAFVGAYVGLTIASHPSAATWPAPAAGAVVGTALPLQAVVVALMRSLTR